MNGLSISINGTSNNQLNASLKNTLEKIEAAHSINFNESPREQQDKNGVEQTGFSLS